MSLAEPKVDHNESRVELHSPSPEQIPAPRGVASLRSLFPATELTDDDLQAVLDSQHGSIEGATESLLAMNDPTYQPDAQQKQLQADAELARQLAFEEEQRYQQQRQARIRNSSRDNAAGSATNAAAPGILTYTPYVPKRARATPAMRTDGEQTAMEDRDELDQLQEQFSKLAEQGKKTFGTFLGKAKDLAGSLNDRINASASPSTNSADETSSTPLQKTAPSSAGTSTAGVSSATVPTAGPSLSAPTIVPERLPRPPVTSAQVPRPDSSLTTPAGPTSSKDLPAIASASTDETKKSDLSKIEGLLLPRQSVNLKKADADSDDDDDLEYVRSPFDDD